MIISLLASCAAPLIPIMPAEATQETGIPVLPPLKTQDGNLVLSVDRGSVFNLWVRGRSVGSNTSPLCSGIKVDGKWYTSQNLEAPPIIKRFKNGLKISRIEYGGGGVTVSEIWTLSTSKDAIRWRIERKYLSAGNLDDTAMPKMTFAGMNTWTGAILGTGGVAWGKLFDQFNATYGIHTNSATFWNPDLKDCLKVVSSGPLGSHQALCFTREPNNDFSMSVEPTKTKLLPRKGHYRYLKNSQDIWASFPVTKNETISTTVLLTSPNYQSTFGRGDFKGLDTDAITNIMNTIGRIGDIDDKLMGSNGWYSGYICLHEPWIAQMGIAIDDPNYIKNYAKALNYYRDHALQPDGMVKSRWCYGSYDAQPGTYDKYGFYEAQWGRLEDTQSSYVTDVANEFDLNGSLRWVKGQKAACESALQFLLNRDTNGNHLVEMVPNSEKDRRSSDWLDIVWASYENAFVNAQLYGALLQWARVESLLGDASKAAYYRDYAGKLKTSFNKPISEGGFWNPDKGWYIYWRDKDGSVHGDNLTLEVNLTALSVGICDDPHRRERLLDVIETAMKKENLLIWPSCMYPFAPGEAANTHWPDYENGDIFLSWGEAGVHAYAPTQPEVALKYVKNIISQYNKDGLAFQRYSRADGSGQGDDILAGNCNTIVGLYRDIYGIQPKFNRLYLDPHLTPQLNGTVVHYNLRGQKLSIELAVGNYSVSSGDHSISCRYPFGVSFQKNGLTYFAEDSDSPTFKLETEAPISLSMNGLGHELHWSLSSSKASLVTQTFYGLQAGTSFDLVVDGKKVATISADHPTAKFELNSGSAQEFELR